MTVSRKWGVLPSCRPFLSSVRFPFSNFWIWASLLLDLLSGSPIQRGSTGGEEDISFLSPGVLWIEGRPPKRCTFFPLFVILLRFYLWWFSCPFPFAVTLLFWRRPLRVGIILLPSSSPKLRRCLFPLKRAFFEMIRSLASMYAACFFGIMEYGEPHGK